MKMKNRYFQTVAFMSMLLLSLTSLFTSCAREPIEVDDASNTFDLVIRPRWIELEKRPTGFTAIIYPTDGSQPKTYLSNNVDSIKVQLPAGGYRVLIYNQSEAEYHTLSFRHMESYYDSQICLTENTETSCQYPIMAKAFFANEPAEFASDCCNELYVDPKDIEIARRDKQRIRKVLTMKPHVIISTLYVKLRVKGIYNGYAQEGCIDGTSGSVFPTYWDAGEDRAAELIKSWKVLYDGISSEWGYYEGKVRVGGMPGTSLYLTSGASIETTTVSADPEKSRAVSRSETVPTFLPEDVYLHMRVLLVDLKTVVEKTYAVGDLIERRINDPLVLDLNLEKDPLELPYAQPADGSGASGFDAEVEDWKYTGSDINF